MDKECLESVKDELKRCDSRFWLFDTHDIEGIISTVEEQQDELNNINNLYIESNREIWELEQEVKSLRETLNFYADHENWWTYPVPGGYASAASADKGRRARKGLED